MKMIKKAAIVLAAVILGTSSSALGGLPLAGASALTVQAEEEKAPVRAGFYAQDDGLVMQAFNDSAKDVLFRINLYDGEGDGQGHYFLIAPVSIEDMEATTSASDPTLLKARMVTLSNGSEAQLGEHEDEVAHYLTFTLPAGTSMQTFLKFTLQPGKKLAIVPQQVEGFFYTTVGETVLYAGNGEILSGASEPESVAGAAVEEPPVQESEEETAGNAEAENPAAAQEGGEAGEGLSAAVIGTWLTVIALALVGGLLAVLS